MLRVIVARKNRQRGREQRHVARPLAREAQHHGRIVGRLRADEVAQQLLGARVAFVLEDLQRERDVMGGERAAVVELDAGPHQKAVSEPIRGYANRARGEAVEGIRLIGRARHQAGEGELHALRAVALEDEDVERIEGEKVLIEGAARPDLGEQPALWRIRDVVLPA
jgi:hypothetical protein